MTQREPSIPKNIIIKVHHSLKHQSRDGRLKGYIKYKYLLMNSWKMASIMHYFHQGFKNALFNMLLWVIINNIE